MADLRKFAPDDLMNLAAEHMKTQMPEEMNSVNSLGPANWFERQIMPDNALAITLPFGRVAYNPTMLDSTQSTQSEADDTLAHELTHIRQANRTGILEKLQNLFSPPRAYEDRPDEEEAFQIERVRQVKRRDIKLPK